jgi:PBP1b-binding outer membrane lipoprotein LpoB
MKTIATASAVALLVVLTGCDGGSPAVKSVQKNDAAPAAGSVKSPNVGLKDRMKAADSSTASSAAGTPKKAP